MNTNENRQTPSVKCRPIPFLVGIGILCSIASIGCWKNGSTKTENSDSIEKEKTSESTNASFNPNDREIWEEQAIKGNRVGYGCLTLRPETLNGEALVRIKCYNQLKFSRDGQPIELVTEYASLETLDGRLRAFQTKVSQGTTTILESVGSVQDDKLNVELSTQGKQQSASVPWSKQYMGLYAIERTLLMRRLKPGEKLTVRAWVPVVNQLGTSLLTAGQEEEIDIDGNLRKLQRIDIIMTLQDGQKFPSTCWIDRSGDVLRRHEVAMDMVLVRTSKQRALKNIDQARFDLMRDLFVPVDRRIDRPHETKRARYRLHIERADPADVFPNGLSQRLEPIDKNTARLTVYAIRPNVSGNPEAQTEKPTDKDLKPNNLIQSDHPGVVAAAENAVGTITDPWEMAVALETHVKEWITHRDYSQAFATAAEVLENRTGDCTEHAVLLAAMARARQIPTRIVIGLVYIDSTNEPSFGYHMWNEVYIAKRWIPLDATLARGGIGIGHLKLTHSNLDGISAFSSFLPVAQVAGNLKISIEQTP